MPYCLASFARRRATGSDAMRARCASETYFGLGTGDCVEDFAAFGFGLGDEVVCNCASSETSSGKVLFAVATTSSYAVSSSTGKSLHSFPTFSFQKPMTVFEVGQMHALSRWRRKQCLFSMKNRQQYGGGVQ
jgi:hypothetical protein